MIRCVKCGCSRFDPDGVRCALCGGSPALRTEQCYVTQETKATLLAQAEELKAFGVTLEECELLRKDLGTTLGAVGLVLQISESLSPGVLRRLVLFLRSIAIPENEIIRLRLDEPEKISAIYRAENGSGK